MNWTETLQDIISGSVSGIIVASVCGLAAWLIYDTGIRGKERGQIASERKNTIFIPLKYEMKRIASLPDDIWQDIDVEIALNIVDKEDEFVVDDDLYQQCQRLVNLIREYRYINPYSVASTILCRRFEEKCTELYGSITHQVFRYDEVTQQEVELEDYDPEIYTFMEVANSRLNINNIFHNQDLEDYQASIGFVGPVEEYLVEMFEYALPKKEKYKGILFENIKDAALAERRITPAEYIAKGFNFFKIFDEDDSIKKKVTLLSEIKQISFEIYELTTAKIRSIGQKYEKE